MLNKTIESISELKYFNESYYYQRLKNFAIPDNIVKKYPNLIEGFLNLPIPNKSMEEWRRTDISRIPFDEFIPLDAEIIEMDAQNKNCNRITISTDKTIVELDPELKDSGVIFLPLIRAMQDYPEKVTAYFNTTKVSDDHLKFQLWSAAFFNRGIFVFVPAGLNVENPFEVHVDGDFAGRSVIMHNIFAVEKNASAMVELHFHNSDKVDKQLFVVTDEGFCDDNARLEVLSIQNTSQQTWFFNNTTIKQQRDSAVDWHAVVTGSKLHKSFIGGGLDGPGAIAHLNGAYFAEKKQHIDMRTMQIHNSGHTDSNLLFKGAVKDKAHTIYQGMIQVAKDAQIVDAYQTNKNLILHEGARADSIPGLEINADDVKCSHGATVGHINPEEVFYLQSRGIDDDDARKMIISGFFEDVLSRIKNEKASQQARELIEEKINR